MKTQFAYFLTICLAVFTFVSCEDNPTSNDDSLTLSLSANPSTLIESAEEEGTVTIGTDGLLPDEGVGVTLLVSASDGSAKPLARFKIASFNPETDLEGAVLTQQPNPQELNRLDLQLTSPTATIKLTASDDDFDSGPIDITFSIQSSEDFEVEEGEGSASFSIVEE